VPARASRGKLRHYRTGAAGPWSAPIRTIRSALPGLGEIVTRCRMSRPTVFALLAALAWGCVPPGPPNPAVGETRFLCCNLRYEKNAVTDVNYQVGTRIAVGTRVHVTEAGGNRVTFEPEGHPPLTVVFKYGRKTLSFDEYLDRLLVRDDPRRTLPAGDVRTLVEAGEVEPGMTRDQVVMSLGYPPAHRTPSLSASTWTYWQNRWVTMVVAFDGDRVSRVVR